MRAAEPTSHMAIIAASFGMPTLVAMGPQLSRVPEGARVLLDAIARRAGHRSRRSGADACGCAGASSAIDDRGDCLTRDGERITLARQSRRTERRRACACRRRGRLRAACAPNFCSSTARKRRQQEEQLAAYQAIADALGGRPLTIRTLDIGGDKPVPYIRFPDEQNPALGARGIRTGLFAPELIDEQLRAIARVAGRGDQGDDPDGLVGRRAARGSRATGSRAAIRSRSA